MRQRRIWRVFKSRGLWWVTDPAGNRVDHAFLDQPTAFCTALTWQGTGIGTRMRIHADGGLRAALYRLDDAIDALIEPQPVTIDRDDGTHPTAWTASPYRQLQCAVAGQSGERSGGRNSLPLWTDALDLLVEIDTAVQCWHPAATLSDESPLLHTITRLRAIQARKWRPQDTQAVARLAHIIKTWTTDIHTLIDGAHTAHLKAAHTDEWAACPNCDTRTTQRVIVGETVRTPALQLRYNGTAHCTACHTTWDAQWLAIVLGYTTPAAK